MEKENIELSNAAAGKHESPGSKRHRPIELGSLAIESEPDSDERPAKSRGTDAEQLHPVKPAPEHIGHMLMSAESKRADREQKPELSHIRAETLNRAELMSLCETIYIDGSSLRQIYETHLIGERGLRRLVAEYLRHGDLKQALRNEVMEREKDFERDPVMRDMTPDLPETDNAKESATLALHKLLEQAVPDTDDKDEETAFYKARAKYEARELHKHKQGRRIMDVSLATIIAALLILVVALLLARI